MSETVHYLTPEGRAQLEQELERLKTAGRQAIADNLRRAIREGDLSENFGYTETKREQARLEGRILEITAVLNSAQLVEPHNGVEARVGSTVTVTEPGGAPERYQIVGPAEADPARGRISHESPIGRALLGHKAGDHVEAKTPGGVLRFEILEIA
jgi:transcription elongation factor GreA